MKFLHRALLITALLVPATGLAQVPNDVELIATGETESIRIAVDMDVGGTLPAEWVGWVIERNTIGQCDTERQIGGVTPFPTGSRYYSLRDYNVVADWTYRYRIWAVDAEGGHHTLPPYTEWPPVYYHIDDAALNDDGYVVLGTVIDYYGDDIQIVPCSDSCWAYLAFIQDPPAELKALAGTDQVVMIRGPMLNNFEGPYMMELTSWYFAATCLSPTGTEDLSWGALKVRFR